MHAFILLSSLLGSNLVFAQSRPHPIGQYSRDSDGETFKLTRDHKVVVANKGAPNFKTGTIAFSRANPMMPSEDIWTVTFPSSGGPGQVLTCEVVMTTRTDGSVTARNISKNPSCPLQGLMSPATDLFDAPAGGSANGPAPTQPARSGGYRDGADYFRGSPRSGSGSAY